MQSCQKIGWEPDLPEQDFAKRMVDMVNQRKKYFAEERAKAKRNKSMTQSQLRIYMSNYLKNQGIGSFLSLKKTMLIPPVSDEMTMLEFTTSQQSWLVGDSKRGLESDEVISADGNVFRNYGDYYESEKPVRTTQLSLRDDAIQLSTANISRNNLNNHNNNISSTTSSTTIKHRRSDPSKSNRRVGTTYGRSDTKQLRPGGKVSQVVNEIVSDAVDWAMQALLRARFRDLPTIDMKEILQQRMFKDNYYKAHEVYNDLIEALQKSLELDYSNQRLADQEEACEKKRKKHATPRTPSGSPPSPPPPPPPPASASGAPGISGASGSSQLPPPPPHPSTGTSGSAQQ
ncbi:hypothetical protein Tco_1164256 [Tanacetum coccineum]